jgi:hypothetical protein
MTQRCCRHADLGPWLSLEEEGQMEEEEEEQMLRRRRRRREAGQLFAEKCCQLNLRRVLCVLFDRKQELLKSLLASKKSAHHAKTEKCNSFETLDSLNHTATNRIHTTQPISSCTCCKSQKTTPTPAFKHQPAIASSAPPHLSSSFPSTFSVNLN